MNNQNIKNTDATYSAVYEILKEFYAEGAVVIIDGQLFTCVDEVRDNCSAMPCQDKCKDSCPAEPHVNNADGKPKGEGPYINIKGEHFFAKPNPGDYVKDNPDLSLEGEFVVVVWKVGMEGSKAIVRHSFGSKRPTEDAIRWCLLRYQGYYATVDYDYILKV